MADRPGVLLDEAQFLVANKAGRFIESVRLLALSTREKKYLAAIHCPSCIQSELQSSKCQPPATKALARNHVLNDTDGHSCTREIGDRSQHAGGTDFAFAKRNDEARLRRLQHDTKMRQGRITVHLGVLRPQFSVQSFDGAVVSIGCQTDLHCTHALH